MIKMKSIRSVIKIIPLLIFVSICFAEDPAQKKAPSIEELQLEQDFQNVMKSLDKMEVLSSELVQNKRFACLKAFGNKDFCNCIVDNLPIIISFKNYIALTTSSKDEIGYEKLPKDDQELFDKTITARNLCVKKVFLD
jgi:hypothetical protein